MGGKRKCGEEKRGGLVAYGGWRFDFERPIVHVIHIAPKYPKNTGKAPTAHFIAPSLACLMSLHRIDLTTALRPSLLPDETLLFVQDAVGIYEGKYKVPNLQNGHLYLTSHRACYVGNEAPREHAVAVDLKEIDRPELYAGFLKSSPKVILYPKPSRRLATSPRPPNSPGSFANASSPARTNGSSWPASRSSTPSLSSATWICPICSLSNPVPSNFDATQANANTPLPPCQACGIKPSLSVILKAAISSRSQAQPTLASGSGDHDLSLQSSSRDTGVPGTDPQSRIHCPRCTFLNYPSLSACELCGFSLASVQPKSSPLANDIVRSESPGPLMSGDGIDTEPPENIKFSFRGGGEKVFFERLKGALVQRKWLLQSAPPVPKPSGASFETDGNSPALNASSSTGERQKQIGIAGLERRGLQLRQNNEAVIGNAFEDLEALMTSAKEIIQLAESFRGQIDASENGGESAEAASLLSQSADALGLVATRDMLRKGNAGADALYLSELARQLAEFLTDDARGILRGEGGMMTLIDLWAIFNRARGGVELVSPSDFGKAARLWEKLKLPVRLRSFKSGLLVVQSNEWTDDKTIAALLSWLTERHKSPPPMEVKWDWRLFGHGITAQEVADRFKWSIAVATEELEMAEEKGVLCREEAVEGVRFWENYIVDKSLLA